MLIAKPDGSLAVFQLGALPFGSRRSTANWARMAGFAHWVLLEIEKVCLAVYVDDCITVEPVSTCAPAFDMVATVNEVTGIKLASDESERPCSEIPCATARPKGHRSNSGFTQRCAMRRPFTRAGSEGERQAMMGPILAIWALRPSPFSAILHASVRERSRQVPPFRRTL